MAGGSPNDDSISAQIAGRGRFVVFLSRASDLVPIDTDGEWQAYLYDRVEGTTTLVSRNAADQAGNADTEQVVVDANGRWIAYVSEASNLVDDDTNGVADVFLYRVSDGTTRLITRDAGGDVVAEESHGVDISNNGKVLAVGSYASNLVADDDNDSSDVFRYDRTTNDWELISRNDHGDAANGNSYQPVISPDGGYVAFTSNADDLADEDDNFIEDVYLYRHASDRIELVSRALDDTAASAESYSESISRNGRAVTFSSAADDLVEGDSNDDTDVFLFRTARRDAVSLVSKTKAGSPGNGFSAGSALNGSAKLVIFASRASDLVGDDDNESSDVFVHRLPQ
jgi:Tol biopolymer transport system component